MKILFAILFGVVALSHLYACVPPARPLVRRATKPLLMPLLICCYCFFSPAPEWMAIAALALFFAGDALLLFPNQGWTVQIGLWCYAAGQALYAAKLLTLAGSKPSFVFALIAVGAYAACVGASLYLTAPRIPEGLFLPVCACTVTAGLASLFALLYAVSRAGISSKIVFAGTLLLFFSGALRAYYLLRRNHKIMNLIVMLSYISAQACIIFGLAAGGA